MEVEPARLPIFEYASRVNPTCGTRPGMTTSKLRPGRGEGITGGNLALGEARHEPLLALLSRAVGEGIGHDAAFRALLQGIVADGGSGLQRSVHVAGIEE